MSKQFRQWAMCCSHVGSDWVNGPPRTAASRGKTPTQPDSDVIVSLEREFEIARHIRRFLDNPK